MLTCGYAAMVIVAHSLGALISADLLHFLRRQKDPELEPFGYGALPRSDEVTIPITLFMMGNPLHQLLNRFFPYLYDWVRAEPDNGTSTLSGTSLAESADIDANASSDPVELGVRAWWNAYRSGDYVGRSLSLDEWHARNAAGAEGGTPATDALVVTDGSAGRGGSSSAAPHVRINTIGTIPPRHPEDARYIDRSRHRRPPCSEAHGPVMPLASSGQMRPATTSH